MEALRELLAVIVYIAGAICFTLFAENFEWYLVLVAVVCFVSAYIIWPSRRRGDRQKENIFLEVLEFVVELPVDIFLWLLRFFGRLFRNKDGGIDIDF